MGSTGVRHSTNAQATSCRDENPASPSAGPANSSLSSRKIAHISPTPRSTYVYGATNVNIDFTGRTGQDPQRDPAS